MERNWRQELDQNTGKLFAPDGTWLVPHYPLLRLSDEDVWCSPKEVLRSAWFEQQFAVFMESAVQAGHCESSGEARADFVCEHNGYRATGDFFDWRDRYVARDAEIRDTEHDGAAGSVLGAEARRTMNHLKEKVERPRRTLLPKRLMPRMAAYSWAWKVHLARAGYPEYCVADSFSGPQG